MALQWFCKYTKILYIVFLLPLFVTQTSRNVVLNCLITSVFIGVSISYLNNIGWLDMAVIYKLKFLPGEGLRGIIGNITQFSILTAFVCYILLNRIAAKKQLFLSVMLLLLLSGHLYFINTERTGGFLLLILVGLFICQYLGLKKIWLAVICLPLILATLYFVSPNFKTRLHSAISDVKLYTQAKEEHTSLGLRFAFVDYSLKIIKEHPFFGVGMGGFWPAYEKFGGPIIPGKPRLNEPHNDYIFLTVQAGFLGLAAMLLWIGLQWYGTLSLWPLEKRLAQALIVTFCLSSLANPIISITPTGGMYAIFLAVLFAARITNRREDARLKGK